MCLCRGQTAYISDSWFVGNTAANSGAGLVFDKTNANVAGSVFKNNHAQVRMHHGQCMTPSSVLLLLLTGKCPSGLLSLKPCCSLLAACAEACAIIAGVVMPSARMARAHLLRQELLY